MTIEEAIKKANEGGFTSVQRVGRAFLQHNPLLRADEKFGRTWEEEKTNAIIFLDPTFWKALGQSYGRYMGEQWGKCPDCEKEDYYGSQKFCSNHGKEIQHYWKGDLEKLRHVSSSWFAHWHHFIDHLADGKTAESFFEKLD